MQINMHTEYAWMNILQKHENCKELQFYFDICNFDFQ